MPWSQSVSRVIAVVVALVAMLAVIVVLVVGKSLPDQAGTIGTILAIGGTTVGILLNVHISTVNGTKLSAIETRINGALDTTLRLAREIPVDVQDVKAWLDAHPDVVQKVTTNAPTQ